MKRDGSTAFLTMKTGSQLIAEERQRQIDAEGYNSQHDDQHENGELARAAASYALPKDRRVMENRTEIRDNARGVADPPEEYPVKVLVPEVWPWDAEWWRPTPRNRVRELVKAGALIAAEIDRLQRQSNASREARNNSTLETK